MGTRADFYVGRNHDAEWLGSIAWDGYRDGIDDSVLKAHSEAEYRAAVSTFIAGRADATLPENGWPWPWDNSGTTDCSYWFFDGRAWDVRGEYERLGERFAPCDEPEPDWGSGDEDELYHAWLSDKPKLIAYPDMSARKNVAFGKRSGMIIVSA